MPLCPLNESKSIDCICNNKACFNNIPSLDFHCLHIHCSVYEKSAMEVLNLLYGKSYRMMTSLTIKAIRVAFILNELTPNPSRKMESFEKRWVDSINAAGYINPKFSWLEVLHENKNFSFLDRMAQILNTMEVTSYSLLDIIDLYQKTFDTIDFRALAINEIDAKEILQFIEE